MASSNITVLLTIGVITVVVVRIIYVIYRSSKPLHSKSPRFLGTLVVLGSGGHTAEMLNLLYVLQKERLKPRYYIAAATDNMSLQKAKTFEDSLVGKVLGIQWSSIFYVESIARVRKLSLSGLLLYKLRMADQLFVQWTQLKKKYPQAHYVGCLM